MEIESPGEGILLEIAVEEGKGVPPGTPIAYIGHPDEKVVSGGAREEAAASIAAEPETAAPAFPQVKESPSPAGTSGEKVKISPVARKMAAEANLDIGTLSGTGPGGRITKEDVQKALENVSQESTPEPSEQKNNTAKTNVAQPSRPLAGMRKVIAERMHSSLQNSAQLTIHMKADITELKNLQTQSAEPVKRRFGEKLTLTDFIARAAILALQAHPLMNSALKNDSIQENTNVHLGMAVALEKGLVVPVIKDAVNLSLSQLSAAIREMAKKARENQLGSEEMTGSTFYHHQPWSVWG